MAEDPFIGFTTESLRFSALLGKGGMGSVYRGEQLHLKRTVAIKVIASHLVADPTYIGRFTREAQVLSSLVHPNIIACYNYGPTRGPHGEPIFVMELEYVDGWSLLRYTQLHRPSVRQVLELYRQVADGLAFAHRLKVIHRDIKPDNILMTKAGVARIADFGLARREDSVQVTQTGAIIGSPAYMSPEACRGEEPGKSSDIYSFGCALFQTLTDQTPYSAQSSLQVINQHLTQPVPSLLALRPDLVRLQPILARCLAKRPADRWPDAASLAAALASEVAQHPPDLVAGRLRRAATMTREAAATVLTGAVATEVEVASVPALPRVGISNRWWWGAVAMVAVILGAAALLTTPSATEVHPPNPTPIHPSEPSVVTLTPSLAVPEEPAKVASPAIAQDKIDALLARSEQDFAAGKIDAAEAMLTTLHGLVPSDELLPETRTRLDELAERIDRTRVKSTSGIGVVRMLKPLRGDAVAVRQLPNLAPIGPQTILASSSEAGAHVVRIRLPPNSRAGDQDGLVLMLGSETAQQIVVSTVDDTRPQKLASFSIPEGGWSVNVISLKAINAFDEFQISAATAPFFFVSAALRTGALPTASDLSIHPGTLAASRDIHQRSEAAIAKHPDFPRFQATRILIPQRALALSSQGREGLLAAVNRGLLTVGSGATSGIPESNLRVYTTIRELQTEMADLGDSQLVLVYLPSFAQRLLLKELLTERDADRGTLIIPILPPDSLRPPGGGGPFEMLENNRRTLINLAAVVSFYQAQDVPLLVDSPIYGKELLGGLEAGLRQLRARLLAVSEQIGHKQGKNR